MGSFNEALFEQKLLYLKDTHDSIANLSSWCLSHQEHHGKIVSTWLNVLKRVKTEHRLLLFYLANDVIQYSKRKSLPFTDSFAPALQKATTMVREDSVRNKILRLFKIWNERGIYDEGFLVDLSGLLSRVHKNTTRIDVQEFQPSVMYSRIRSCKELEDDTDVKLNTLNESHISFTDIEKLQNSLKGALKKVASQWSDRENGDELLVDFDAGLATVKAYIKALEAEIKERHGLIDLLEIGEQYYEREFQEAKVVVNAYKCFGTRVRGVKRKLEEQIETMPSPMPSPDVNAPSPSPEPKDGISSTIKTSSDFKSNNYFPPHEVKKDSETTLVSPYSPDSNFDAEPVDSTQHAYPGQTDELKVYVPPKLQKHYKADIAETESIQSNSNTPYGLVDALSAETFHHGHSFLKSAAANNFQIINGNNIEVITSSDGQQLTLSALLQTLMPSENSTSTSKSQVAPTTDLSQPPKFSGWSDEPEHVWETPESPPPYEKANYPTVFDENILSQDIDMRFSDVDHRNLINLTETASSTWVGDDTDYRTKEHSKKTNAPSTHNQDNVENVDMEMSDEEEKLNENVKSDVIDLLQPPTTRSSDLISAPVQNPPTKNFSFNLPKDESYFKINSEEKNVKSPIHPEAVPSLSYNNSATSYTTNYPNNSTYTTNNNSYNSNPSSHTVSPSSSSNNGNNSIPPFKTCYSEIYVSPAPPPVKVDAKGITDFNLNKYPSPSKLQPPLPPPLPPPPPPPPPHPTQLWSQPFATPPPPPQFDTSQNFSQQSLFFSRPPPPVPPSPQMPMTNRTYRNNFRPFQRVNTRFQRW
ncbi:uncharacterized protein [Halyomorpha halys]|uniref:uncharacterized protein isoform X2 n=1 Tax=Halyomorpha halys TaxID=286706 RepID=UPI0006D4FBA7|nr:actin cytoskeleton-regulatory complex protein PAN1 isoform X2 [Halyomorpha halys]